MAYASQNVQMQDFADGSTEHQRAPFTGIMDNQYAITSDAGTFNAPFH